MPETGPGVSSPARNFGVRSAEHARRRQPDHRPEGGSSTMPAVSPTAQQGAATPTADRRVPGAPTTESVALTLDLGVDGGEASAAPARAGLDPDLLWRQFALPLASRPRCRISTNHGRTYSREIRLTSRRPARPAAICLYDAGGAGRVLAVDLDTSRGGRGQVLADSHRLTTLLDHAGARYLTDESPTGGRHVWVPLARPLPATELQLVVRALGQLLPSLDPSPMLNPHTGCLRPPGSAHPAGGHQTLVTPWARAVDAVRTGTSSTAWAALTGLLAPQLAAIPPTGHPVPADAATTARPGGARPLPTTYEAIARTGRHDRGRYRSPSEARMAVLASAAAHGWSRADVQTTLAAGTWPGLASYYARYRPGHRPSALARDWTKALAYARALPPADPTIAIQTPVANFDTGEHPSQPPAHLVHRARRSAELAAVSATAKSRADSRLGSSSEYVHVRVWRTAVDLETPHRWADRAGASKRAVLAALAEAAHRRGSRYLAVGCRSLGLGSTLDHSTVANVLRSLRDEPDPVIVLIEDHRGERGDLYELRVPDSRRDEAEVIPWRPGRLTGIHPVFHALGISAAHLYQALATGPADVDTLVESSHLSRATVYRTLQVLGSHGLVTRTGYRWRPTRLHLDSLARRLGIPGRVAALLDHIRAERQQWRQLLGLGRSLTGPGPLIRIADLVDLVDLPPPPEPPPQLPFTPLELLNLVLGAVPIEP